MGMFDNLRVEVEVPGLREGAPNEFQTKDLECELNDYIISSNGRLLKRVSSGIVEDTNSKKGNLEFVRDMNLDGELEFHDGVQAFVALFEKGNLVSIWEYDRYGEMQNLLDEIVKEEEKQS